LIPISPQAAACPVTANEIRGPSGDPADEGGETRVLAQGLDRVVGAGEVGLREGRVDFIMTDLVQKNHGPGLAAAEPGDKVVAALRDLGRDRAAAEGAERIVHHEKDAP